MENQEFTTKLEIRKNGPLRVHAAKINIEYNESEESKESIVSICRCGQSQKMPYCDGAHKEIEPFE